MDQNITSFPTIETTAEVGSLPQERQSCSHDTLLKANGTESSSEPNKLDYKLHLLPTHQEIGEASYTQQTSIENWWC